MAISLEPRRNHLLAALPDVERSRWLPQLELPPADVMPRTQLEADVAVDPDRLKSDSLVQCHAGRIWKRDACEDLVEAKCGQSRQQRRVQALADA